MDHGTAPNWIKLGSSIDAVLNSAPVGEDGLIFEWENPALPQSTLIQLRTLGDIEKFTLESDINPLHSENPWKAVSTGPSGKLPLRRHAGALSTAECYAQIVRGEPELSSLVDDLSAEEPETSQFALKAASEFKNALEEWLQDQADGESEEEENDAEMSEASKFAIVATDSAPTLLEAVKALRKELNWEWEGVGKAGIDQFVAQIKRQPAFARVRDDTVKKALEIACAKQTKKEAAWHANSFLCMLRREWKPMVAAVLEQSGAICTDKWPHAMGLGKLAKLCAKFLAKNGDCCGILSEFFEDITALQVKLHECDEGVQQCKEDLEAQSFKISRLDELEDMLAETIVTNTEDREQLEQLLTEFGFGGGREDLLERCEAAEDGISAQTELVEEAVLAARKELMKSLSTASAAVQVR